MNTLIHESTTISLEINIYYNLSIVDIKLLLCLDDIGMIHSSTGESMGSEIDIVQKRLNSFLGQLQVEFGILDRIVYKNKNQHRRSSYFQYLLKVIIFHWT